jgi:hypothetical protein
MRDQLSLMITLANTDAEKFLMMKEKVCLLTFEV